MAQDAADDRAAQQIVAGQTVTAHGGDAAALDALAIGPDLAVVLRIASSNAADRAHTHAI